MSQPTPSEAPPAYTESGSSTTRPQAQTGSLNPQTAKIRNGIPTQSRRSMEDEARPLPSGWVRQYDDKEHHQFFVDTTSEPPRSIWAHPYDDPTYINSLSSEERSHIAGLHRVPSDADMLAESSMDEDQHDAKLPPRPEEQPKGVHKLGRKMKDKLTSSTHHEREEKRRKRAEEERRAYEMHQKIRQAMSKAMQTGQPQLLGRDKDGKEVYVEPPSQNQYPGYGSGYGYSPYSTGIYNTPNARYIRPQAPYARPYGYGYGGGLGLPLAAGVGGGFMLGGLLGAPFLF